MLMILVSVLAACGGVLATIPLTLEIEEMFERFITEHNRYYDSESEKLARLPIFKKNVEEAIRKNLEINDTVFGITKFMDLTIEEFTSKHACFNPDLYTANMCNVVNDYDIPNVAAPESFDWREHQAVTRIKDQGKCGSCWAFGTIGNVEGKYAIKNNELLEFSEQQLVDCDDGSGACNGGFPSSALSYLVEAGIMTESEYPYAEKNQSCSFDSSKVKVKLSGCNIYTLTSQEKLKQLVYQNGPVTLGLDSRSLQSYQGKTLPASACINVHVDHAVLLVGYGVVTYSCLTNGHLIDVCIALGNEAVSNFSCVLVIENGLQYWLIKNSWGENYGDGGYFKIERGEGTNACGIMNNSGTASAILA